MEKKYQPVYGIDKSSSLIYDNKNSSPRIKVILEDSIMVKENVYVTTLALWNKGNEEIKPEQVRRPILVFCSDSIGKILDFKIASQSDPKISNFRLTQIGDSIRIDWDYFDPKGGCKVQILYSGQVGTEVIMSGRIGNNSLHKVAMLGNNPRGGPVNYIFIPGMIFIIVFPVVVYYSPKSKYFKDRKTLITTELAVLFVFVYGCYSLLILYFQQLPFINNRTFTLKCLAA